MGNKFEMGDRVRIITDALGEAGKLFIVDDISGHDDNEDGTLYRHSGTTNGYLASELVMVQPKWATENARHELAPAPASSAEPVAGAGDSELVRLSHALEHEASENVTLKMELAEALGLHRHEFLDADGDESIIEQIEALRRQAATMETNLVEANKRNRALETALETRGEQLNMALIQRDDARDALKLCINADVVGFWSAEEVAKRYFADASS